jgi:ribosomal-protein-alanine N-acetyltransferase
MLAGYYSLALDVNGVTTGYGIMSVAAGEAHLLNLCVHPSSQRLGYGRQLLEALLERADQCEVRKVFLEVRPSNKAALNLYYSFGFAQNAVVLSLALRSSY